MAPTGAGRRSTPGTATASCSTTPQTCLVGQPGRAVLQHPAAAVPAGRQLPLERGAAHGGAGVHRRVEPGPGPSVSVDLHRVSVASWDRGRLPEGRVRGPPDGTAHPDPSDPRVFPRGP